VFLSSRGRHTSSKRDWSSDVCSSDLPAGGVDEPTDRRNAVVAARLPLLPERNLEASEEGAEDHLRVLRQDGIDEWREVLLVEGRSEERRVGNDGISGWPSCSDKELCG